ncbi:hypothetical protein pb186bvf_004424 [Paramecium bursaria]
MIIYRYLVKSVKCICEHLSVFCNTYAKWGFFNKNLIIYTIHNYFLSNQNTQVTQYTLKRTNFLKGCRDALNDSISSSSALCEE